MCFLSAWSSESARILRFVGFLAKRDRMKNWRSWIRNWLHFRGRGRISSTWTPSAVILSETGPPPTLSPWPLAHTNPYTSLPWSHVQYPLPWKAAHPTTYWVRPRYPAIQKSHPGATWKSLVRLLRLCNWGSGRRSLRYRFRWKIIFLLQLRFLQLFFRLKWCWFPVFLVFIVFPASRPGLPGYLSWPKVAHRLLQNHRRKFAAIP